MVKKQAHLVGSDVVCVRCVNSQTVASVNRVKIWSSLVELAKRNSAVMKGGLYATKQNRTVKGLTNEKRMKIE